MSVFADGFIPADWFKNFNNSSVVLKSPDGGNSIIISLSLFSSVKSSLFLFGGVIEPGGNLFTSEFWSDDVVEGSKISVYPSELRSYGKTFCSRNRSSFPLYCKPGSVLFS